MPNLTLTLLKYVSFRFEVIQDGVPPQPTIPFPLRIGASAVMRCTYFFFFFDRDACLAFVVTTHD